MVKSACLPDRRAFVYIIYNFSDACLIFKVLGELAPPPLCQFIKQTDKGNRVTRATIRGDCIVQ
jgi:hypothetical protein